MHFLPDYWFELLAAKGIFWIFCTLLASFFALCKGSDWFVEGAAGAAKKFGIPIIIIGVTIVSLGTTSPETTVSIISATPLLSSASAAPCQKSLLTDSFSKDRVW
jgi:Ca2+/Na+ antiporter